MQHVGGAFALQTKGGSVALLLLTKTGASGEDGESVRTVQAHIPAGDTGETMCRGEVKSVGGHSVQDTGVLTTGEY